MQKENIDWSPIFGILSGGLCKHTNCVTYDTMPGDEIVAAYSSRTPIQCNLTYAYVGSYKFTIVEKYVTDLLNY